MSTKNKKKPLRGKAGNGNFEELQTGIQNIKNYIFSENFHIERSMYVKLY